MNLIFVFFTLFSFASDEIKFRWEKSLGIEETHEYYKNFQVIEKPKETWQFLFSVKYLAEDLKILKDCVYYYIPLKDEGELKVKTISKSDNCKNYLYEIGETHIKNIRSLQYKVEKNIELIITYADYFTESWNIHLNNKNMNSQRDLLGSSAFKRVGVPFLYLVKRSSSEESKITVEKKTNEICHRIDDKCSELAPSDCSLCQDGWYEIPNGCPISPKYCGNQICGKKNGPACVKGKLPLVSKEKSRYHCLEDSDYFYCSPGLKINCEDNLVFCR